MSIKIYFYQRRQFIFDSISIRENNVKCYFFVKSRFVAERDILVFLISRINEDC